MNDSIGYRVGGGGGLDGEMTNPETNEFVKGYLRNMSTALEDNKLQDYLLDVLQEMPHMDYNSAITKTISGINHRQVETAAPGDVTGNGLVFFTRPLLNLTSENVRVVRYLTNLLVGDEYSYNRYIRNALDVRLPHLEGITCPLFDNKSAFIPLLGNQCLSVSGFPEHANPVRVAREGTIRQTHMIYDGVPDIYYKYNLSLSFKELRGRPIISMILSWLYAAGYQFYGTMIPYLDQLLSQMINYQTRIYRIRTDNTKKYVQTIMCSGVSMPETVPTGQVGDFKRDEPILDTGRELTISFPSIGYFYDDPIIMKEFNAVVCKFNKYMSDDVRSSNYVKIPDELLDPLNMEFSYPRININTNELEWWTLKDNVAKVAHLLRGRT